jgi:hypothetical protein
METFKVGDQVYAKDIPKGSELALGRIYTISAIDPTGIMLTDKNLEGLYYQPHHFYLSDASSVVDHPPHYTTHPSGVECINITEHMNFCLGNAVKYIWRSGLKNSESPVTDLQKAKWYIERELARLEKEKTK